MSSLSAVRKSSLAAGLLALLSVSLFLPAVQFEFIEWMDDGVYVVDNPMLRDSLSFQSLRQAFTQTYAASYQPLLWVSFMLDEKMFGLHPMGYHLENILWHAANAALLFLLLQYATASFWRSFLVALLFAVHPMRVESVAWVTERKDVLSTFFLLLALFCHVRWSRSGNGWSYLGLCVAFTLSLMVKAMAVTLPVLLLLFDYWPLQRWKLGAPLPRRVWLDKIPLCLISVTFAGATLLGAKADASTVSYESLPFLARILNALVSITEYTRKTFLPFDLAPLYPHPWWWPWQVVLVAGLFVAVCSVAAVWFARSRPFLFSGWFFFLIALLPVIGFVQSGTQAMADRFIYLPVIGLLWAAVWLAAEFLKKVSAGVQMLSGIALALIYSSVTWIYLPVWKDSGTVFQRAAENTENNYVAHLNLSVWLLQRGKFEEALPHLLHLIRLRPDDAARYLNAGVVFAALGKNELALTAYDKAIELGEPSGNAEFSKGLLLEAHGALEQAVQEYAEARKRDPANVQFSKAYALCLMKLGRKTEALEVVEAALNQKSGWHPDARPGLLDAKAEIEKK